MSNEPPTRDAGAWWRQAFGRPVRMVSFWAAISLPLLYVPLLLSEPASPTVRDALLAMVVVHAVTLWLGRTHRLE